MTGQLYLPPDTDTDLLGEAVHRMLQEASDKRRVPFVEWCVTNHYLQGCRTFPEIDYATGMVRSSYTEEGTDTGIPFKYEELLSKRVAEIGRLLKLDTNPSIVRDAVGLNGLRKESIALALLKTVASYVRIDEIHRSLVEQLVDYGIGGLVVYEVADDQQDAKQPAASVAIDCVPPWELLLLPASAKSSSEVCAVARQRWVPLNSIGKIGGKEVSIDEGDPDYEVRYLPPGSTVWSPPSTGSEAIRGRKDAPDGREPFVRLSEVFLPFRNGRLHRYVVTIGNVVHHGKTYKNNSKAPMMPIAVAIRARGVGLYGRSYVGPLLTVSAEVEAAALNLLRNIQELDLFGSVGIPESWGVSQEELDAAFSGRRKFWIYNPEPMTQDKEVRLQPQTSGTLPNQIIQLGLTLMDRIGQQPEIITQGQAPGRVDSQVGLNFLYQASTLPLGEVAAGIASAYTTIYRAVLGFARKWPALTVSGAALEDDAIAGAVIDPSSGEMDLLSNSVPDPLDVAPGIASAVPVDKREQAQRLGELLSGGVISQQTYRLTARILKLDIPLTNDSEWQNYRMAVLRNIVLFNDGLAPGNLRDARLSPSDYDTPSVHITVLERFMASPEFSLASDDVQSAFGKLLEEFRARVPNYPDQLPYPEEASEAPQAAAPQLSGVLSALGG
jgi:hypothetical protein